MAAVPVLPVELLGAVMEELRRARAFRTLLEFSLSNRVVRKEALSIMLRDVCVAPRRPGQSAAELVRSWTAFFCGDAARAGHIRRLLLLSIPNVKPWDAEGLKAMWLAALAACRNSCRSLVFELVRDPGEPVRQAMRSMRSLERLELRGGAIHFEDPRDAMFPAAGVRCIKFSVSRMAGGLLKTLRGAPGLEHWHLAIQMALDDPDFPSLEQFSDVFQKLRSFECHLLGRDYEDVLARQLLAVPGFRPAELKLHFSRRLSSASAWLQLAKLDSIETLSVSGDPHTVRLASKWN
ncbi:hypothetical protein DFJ74DRAFT_649438 [Hyaloraphidium curvatum]|nr:hypothetical protein DFJ74DRAFT_649438 [Hyaloraphidium curvatum]